MMLTALTRAVSPGIARCELTYLARQPIDYAGAVSQHRAYEEALASLGVRLVSLVAAPRLPDSVFVEDAAIVVDEVAIITRPGSLSRRSEGAAIAPVLSRYRPLEYINSPGTLEGGDVLQVDRNLFVGVTKRTNLEGIAQLRAIVDQYGYRVKEVEVKGCLHLKTGVTAIDQQTLLINRNWIDTEAFRDTELIVVPVGEPMAANTLVISETVLLPASSPITREMLEARGYKTRCLNISELQKAEAGLTCMSIMFPSMR